MINRFSLVSFFTLLVSLFVLSTSVAFAQGVGVRITPALIEETLDPGVSVEYDFNVVNLDTAEQTYYLFTRNITGVAEGGAPIFARDELEVTGYELADWITLPTNRIVVPGGGTESITFTMDVPDNASPGSHFGGVFVSAEPPEIENSGAAVGYQVANIVSIRVSGEAVEQAGIRQFSTGKFLYGAQDVDFNIRIENSGNVLVRPIGPLQINNSLGKQVGEVMFNENQAGVFPNGSREFDLQWIGDSVGFGRYEAILSAGYGGEGAKKTMSSTVTFWVLPYNIILPALGILAFILLVTVIGVRMYIKRTLAQMNAGRRLVRRKGQQNSSMNLLLIVTVLIVIALFLLIMLVLFA
jgi:hypothetical protein